MTERVFVIEPTDAVYRRRIETRPSDGVVYAAMEDFVHHFALRLHHDAGVVTAVDVAAERTPWSTCPDGARALASLIGTDLTEVGDVRQWIGSRSVQCVHTTDLAVIAAAAAVRGTGRDHEVRMWGIGGPERTITMSIDGVEWATWVIGDAGIVDDARSGRFAGLPLDTRSFSGWIADLSVDDREAAAIMRRASTIGLGRGLDMDAWTDATQGGNPVDSCHSYQPEIVRVARRNRGTARATDTEPPGTPVPPATAWVSLGSEN